MDYSGPKIRKSLLQGERDCIGITNQRGLISLI